MGRTGGPVDPGRPAGAAARVTNLQVTTETVCGQLGYGCSDLRRHPVKITITWYPGVRIHEERA
jgi:hypothetical protein